MARFTKGVKPAALAVVQQSLQPGEEIIAAMYGHHRASTEQQIAGLLVGSFGNTTPKGQPPRPGLAGWIPGGPIMLVGTNRRLMSWAIEKGTPVALVGSFGPEHLRSVRRENNLATGQEVVIVFADGTIVTLQPKGVGVGKGFDIAHQAMAGPGPGGTGYPYG